MKKRTIELISILISLLIWLAGGISFTATIAWMTLQVLKYSAPHHELKREPDCIQVGALPGGPLTAGFSSFNLALMLTPPGVLPRSASIVVGGNFQLTMTSVAPVAPWAQTRNSAIATVDSATGMVHGTGVGTVDIIVHVFDGQCMALDSSRFTVADSAGTVVLGNATQGYADWFGNCQRCHMSDWPTDLNTFAFPDTTIIRRALGHVGMQQALNIVAAVNDTLHKGPKGPLTRHFVLFQPGDSSISGATVAIRDSMFGVTSLHFVGDTFPSTWTRDTLLSAQYAIHTTRIPIRLPEWSDEDTTQTGRGNFDWIGTTQFGSDPVSAALKADGQVASQWAKFRANRTLLNAADLGIKVFQRASIFVVNGYSLCTHGATGPDAAALHKQYDPKGCANMMKGMSGNCYLAGVERVATADTILKYCERTIWETGHMFHKGGQEEGKPWCGNTPGFFTWDTTGTKTCQTEVKMDSIRSLQTAAWIYMGREWSLRNPRPANYENEATLYFCDPAGAIGTGPYSLGYGRMCVWMAVKEAVIRPTDYKGSYEICRDLYALASDGNGKWLKNGMRLILRELNDRLDGNFGLSWDPTAKQICTDLKTTTSAPISNGGNYMGAAMQQLGLRRGGTGPGSEYAQIQALADSVRFKINSR